MTALTDNKAAASGTEVRNARTAAARTCLIQLGRYGDILNILPVAKAIADKDGGKVAMVVCKEFIDILEAVSYAVPVQWNGDFMRPFLAAKAFEGRFEQVIISQAGDSIVARERICESFAMESWRYAGYLDRWSDPSLELTLDRRSEEREARLLDSLRLRGRPFILVNPSGHSSKFQWEDQLVSEVQMRWANDAVIVDMRRFRAQRIQDLLGLIDNAIALVTIDTATLHLAEASRTPVIALISDRLSHWGGSNPRRANLVLKMRYREFDQRKSEIHAAIQRVLWERNHQPKGRLVLPVTMLGVDNFTPARTLQALWFSMRSVTVPEAALVCRPGNQLPGDLRGVTVKALIDGRERIDRERFMIMGLHKAFETSHCLHVEWDARIANPNAWDPSWLQYDYIGAPWPWPFEQKPHPACTEKNCVGNLGFALLSKRFTEAVAEIANPTDEEVRLSDVYMCRTLRPKLEEMGLKFAPEAVAARFSAEDVYYHGQWGFHGKGTARMNGFQLL